MGSKKRNIKSAMAAILTTSMVVGSMGLSFAANFSDIENHWAANQIKTLSDRGIIKGYNDGTFKPNSNITRAEFIALINKAYNLKSVYNIEYKDVSSQDWFYEDIRKAKAKGYISGYEDNTIRPNNKITRQEVCVIMCKVFGVNNSNKDNIVNKFKDSDKIAGWAKSSVGTMMGFGYMNGYPDDTFAPDKYITRAEASAMLDKVFKAVTSMDSSTFTERENSKKDSDKDSKKKSKEEKNEFKMDKDNKKLKNKEYKNDLNIDIQSSAKDSDIRLEDVEVQGTTYIDGGKENTIYIEDCKLDKVVVEDKVKLVVQGKTIIGEVTLKSGAILEENLSGSDKLTEKGFDDIIIEDKHKVTLKGEFDDIEVNEKDSDIYLEEGSVSEIYITKDGEDSKVDIDKDAKVNKIRFYSKAEITGEGTIKEVNIEAKYVKIEQTPDKISGDEKDYATINGKKLNEEDKVEVDKKGLEKKIKEAKEKKESEYKDVSWAKLKETLKEAEKINDKKDATENDVKDAVKKLDDAINNLEKKDEVKEDEVKKDEVNKEEINKEELEESNTKK